ncbi:MAG: hypothetical protein U1E92_03165 [Moraxella osloensis]
MGRSRGVIGGNCRGAANVGSFSAVAGVVTVVVVDEAVVVTAALAGALEMAWDAATESTSRRG